MNLQVGFSAHRFLECIEFRDWGFGYKANTGHPNLARSGPKRPVYINPKTPRTHILSLRPKDYTMKGLWASLNLRVTNVVYLGIPMLMSLIWVSTSIG